MTSESHRTSSGARHPGDELDCTTCRDILTQPSAVQDPYDPARPHLMLPPGRTVPLDPGHTVQTSVLPYLHRPGGFWQVWCTCGWRKTGRYARDGVGEIVASRLTETWAARHRGNPLEEA